MITTWHGRGTATTLHGSMTALPWRFMAPHPFSWGLMAAYGTSWQFQDSSAMVLQCDISPDGSPHGSFHGTAR